jgi:hypothetical protein
MPRLLAMPGASVGLVIVTGCCRQVCVMRAMRDGGRGVRSIHGVDHGHVHGRRHLAQQREEQNETSAGKSGHAESLYRTDCRCK